MAAYIGYSKSFLEKNRGSLFFEGTHYFKNSRGTRWKVSEMVAWVEGKEISNKAKDIVAMVS